MSDKIIFLKYDAIHFIKVTFFLAAPYLHVLVNKFLVQIELKKKDKFPWANLKDKKSYIMID